MFRTEGNYLPWNYSYVIPIVIMLSTFFTYVSILRLPAVESVLVRSILIHECVDCHHEGDSHSIQGVLRYVW